MAAAWIHESAIVDEGAVIGEDTKVWHFCHVSSGARIGKKCVLGQNCYLAPTAVIGNGVRVQNNVSIYDGVEIADHVFVGPSVVFTNVTRPRAELSRRHSYETTKIGRGVTIGANATIVSGLSVGEYAFLGAGTVVTRNIPAHALVRGNPARQVGWACTCGEKLPPGATPRCEACGRAYQMNEGALVEARG